MNRKARRPSSAGAIDAAQCKRIWVQDKPPKRGGCPSPPRPRRILEPPEAFGPVEILSVGRACLDKQILPSYGIVPSPPAV
jgi:hypothetical protein